MLRKLLVLTALVLLTPLFAAASVDDFAQFAASVSTRANVDLGDFRVKVAAEFGTTPDRVGSVIRAAGSAGDAYLIFRLGHLTRRSTDEVLEHYRKHKGKGWGQMAHDLGIKPGSREFHDLKKGRYMDDHHRDGRDDDHRRGGDDHGKGGKGKGGGKH